jgi:glycosyltransferase involved in cell wall biosynthesis
MATGNGAYILHKTIEKNLTGYEVIPYSPYRTVFPPVLHSLGRSKHADLVHTTPDYACFHARKNTPLVISFHNYVLDRFMRSYSSRLQSFHYQTDLRWFTKLAIKKASIMTAVSQFTADLATKGLGLQQEIRVIYNGVDEQKFTPVKKKCEKNINVLFSGNLTQRKGVQWLIPILEKLDSHITIFYTSGLQARKLLPDHPRLKCTGRVLPEDMPQVYQRADVLLFPTVREGLSMAALEAMACGLPLVATDCSSFPELIDEGKGGFLCPLGDVDIFAEKINLLAENARLRHEMGEYNRAKIEKFFTLARMLREYRRLFSSLI